MIVGKKWPLARNLRRDQHWLKDDAYVDLGIKWIKINITGYRAKQVALLSQRGRVLLRVCQ